MNFILIEYDLYLFCLIISEICAVTNSFCSFQNKKHWPLIPKVGPWEGCLTQAMEFLLLWAVKACTKPMVVVLFPSPRGVGVMLE